MHGSIKLGRAEPPALFTREDCLEPAVHVHGLRVRPACSLGALLLSAHRRARVNAKQRASSLEEIANHHLAEWVMRLHLRGNDPRWGEEPTFEVQMRQCNYCREGILNEIYRVSKQACKRSDVTAKKICHMEEER